MTSIAPAPEAGGASRQQDRLRWLIWGTFVAFVVAAGWNVGGADLSASYIAGRLTASGHTEALYRSTADPSQSESNDLAWKKAAAGTGLSTTLITTYVQTPLWAYAVSPLAKSVSFAVFRHIFLVLTAIASMMLVGSCCKQWAPALLTPAWQAGLLLGLFFNVPFISGLWLGQTHILFLCLAILAATASLRGREFSAGALLAVAAAVKITPFWLAVTWMVAGRWRSAASFAACSVLLATLGVAAAGWSAFSAYLHVIGDISHHALLSFNSDSLVALLMASRLDADTAFHWKAVSLPFWVGPASTGLLLAAATGGGLLDRSREDGRDCIGSVLILVAATAFAPLAWNHYFVVLVLPVILFLQAWRGRAAPIFVAPVVAVIVLNLPPLAYVDGASLTIVAIRSHLLAALLCLALLPFVPAGSRLSLRARPRPSHAPAP